ncbi:MULTISPECIES: SoxR reducing system RseC family protein [Clostridium]|uniref:SoxR reducing system protein RseC n=4 Tax=Clostridium TaxID=1485 RepID=A0A170NLP1_9CLOT|nr:MULTISPECIES: SoxR reducing system RseC family protein [Clostridium]ADK14203.1 putative positive regulator of sigma E activity [Clostridium ljungdahlii DSM 13528]AGY77429.1 SoxR reducing system RseC family protein [Clostridium autoethanogenum DSM 10061]ALU37570.1 Positive regulator of sigma E RseC/MucC [Clostridium autoethanogenum DSM 10061]OAA86120.1 SoxR reducing system protein RseC [Clostridium ljungdahlii DSM 13528]OAA92244.1 SoxR reducing system protein RseC [Clostridium coskatii]
MKRESEGIVIETSESIAKVRASRHGDCKSCGACPGDNAIVVDAKNPVGAKPGQHVVFEIKDANMLWAAFIVYILPLIGILIGALIGTWIGGKLGHSLREFQIGGGVLFFILSLIYIKIFDRSTSKNESKKPVITKILY